MSFLENAFLDYPKTPDFASNRTVLYIIKYNLIRYVTPTEAFLGHASHSVGLTFACIGFLLIIFEIKSRGSGANQ
jgi:hypothetical protein